MNPQVNKGLELANEHTRKHRSVYSGPDVKTHKKLINHFSNKQYSKYPGPNPKLQTGDWKRRDQIKKLTKP